MRHAAALASSLALLILAHGACGAAPKGKEGSPPTATTAPPAPTGPGGTLEYDGNTTRLGHVVCLAMKSSPSLKLYVTDKPIPADVAKSMSAMETFLYDNKVTQIRLSLAIAETPPRLVDAGIQDFKSKKNPGAESMLVEQPPYVFEKAVADDAHVAGRLRAKGAKTNPNQIPHSLDIQFDIPRGDCQ